MALGFYDGSSRPLLPAAPLTALYPALTALLAFAFLHESITPAKIAGLTLSLAAIYLLSR